MRTLRLLLPALLLAAALAACDFGDGGSLYDPGAQDGPAPVVSSIAPEGVVLAGIDEVTITGQNFSATPEHNTVYFDDGAGAVQRGTVLEASETSLRVRVPNLPNANLRVRVAVRGAQGFSNAVARPLTAAFEPFGGLDAGTRDEVFGITSDDTGALYASYTRGGSPTGVFRFSPEGERTLFSNNTFVWSDLAVGADGALFGTRRLRALFRIPNEEAPVAFSVFPNGVALSAVAAAPDGALWTGGTDTQADRASLYRITPDGAATAFPFAEPVRDLFVFDGALYVASMPAGGGKVRRFPIGADGGLGEGSVVYDVGADLGAGVEVFAIALADDGTLYVGTNADDPVREVTSDGTAMALYPGVLSKPVSGFAWGPGSKLYVAQASQPSPIPEQRGEPAALVRLETRRQRPS